MNPELAARLESFERSLWEPKPYKPARPVWEPMGYRRINPNAGLYSKTRKHQ